MWIAGVALAVAGCSEQHSFEVNPRGSLHTHYLIDFEHEDDPATLHSTLGHLIIFNPGSTDARIVVTAFYEDHEPDRFSLVARANASTESNSAQWSIQRGRRFALKVESNLPVICQATIGWTNTGGNYAWGALTKSAGGPRETARSYGSLTTLARNWFYADAIVLRDGAGHALRRDRSRPHSLWIRESEWAVLLNPSNVPANARLTLHYGSESMARLVSIPAQRLKSVYMDDFVWSNRNYGVTVSSDRDIAVQWLREVDWHGSAEPMAFWSVPAVPFTTDTLQSR
jgi:hypothetical protein